MYKTIIVVKEYARKLASLIKETLGVESREPHPLFFLAARFAAHNSKLEQISFEQLETMRKEGKAVEQVSSPFSIVVSYDNSELPSDWTTNKVIPAIERTLDRLLESDLDEDHMHEEGLTDPTEINPTLYGEFPARVKNANAYMISDSGRIEYGSRFSSQVVPVVLYRIDR